MSWLAEDLAAVGRRLYDDVLGQSLDAEDGMLIDAASSREGGFMPNFPSDTQSGLKLMIRVPSNPMVLRAHLDVLRTRFITSLVLDDPSQLSGDRCNFYRADYPVRCVLGDSPHISAVSRPRMLRAEGRAPYISHASLDVLNYVEGHSQIDNGTLTAQLTLLGAGFGEGVNDVLAVTVGQQPCDILSVRLTNSTTDQSSGLTAEESSGLTIVCSAAPPKRNATSGKRAAGAGWRLKGSPSVTTASGGTGWGCMRLEASGAEAKEAIRSRRSLLESQALPISHSRPSYIVDHLT
jgi:hypothetical protein